MCLSAQVGARTLASSTKYIDVNREYRGIGCDSTGKSTSRASAKTQARHYSGPGEGAKPCTRVGISSSVCVLI